jgi:sarcosine dehydrogenase
LARTGTAAADVVIVGGGIAGTTLAYHLAALGAGRVLALEQNELAAGTTWHAAGAVGRMRVSPGLARLNHRSAAMYARMERETGMPTGWIEAGSYTIARTEERMTQLRRAGGMASRFGVDVEELDRSALARDWPFARFDDVVGGVWLPGDGVVDPVLLVRAIAEGARLHGAEIHEGVHVTGLAFEPGGNSGRPRVTGVETPSGPIEASRVVLCTGMWTPQIARAAGLAVPVQPVEHHYVMSNPVDGARDDMPVVRDPDGCIYFRGRDGALMLGAFQATSKPWDVDRVPDDFAFQLLEPDWAHFAPPLDEGLARLPGLRELGIARFVNGPESFTPDGNPIIGELPGVDGLFVCTGFNSSGLAYGGGVGEALAEWIVAGEPPFDLWALDVRRFSADHTRPEFLRTRGVEVLGTHMRMAYPNVEWEQGRGLRRSPLHDRLVQANACHGEKFGVERPNWFARDGTPARVSYSFERPGWFEDVRAEHVATRERASVFDMSSFGKLEVVGADALTLLQTACANDVDVPPGTIVYTAMLTKRGTFASDLTVLRLADERFLVVTGTAQRVADREWLHERTPDGADVRIVDVTEDWAVLGLMGPHSRDILGELCHSDLSDAAFPFSTAQDVEIAGIGCRALRITYVGELGWELQVPRYRAVALYDALRRSAGPDALANAGYYSINSLRLEKGYRQWGADITANDTPLEAGLSFAVAWDKEPRFHGRDALFEQRDRGLSRRLVSLLLDDPEPMLWGGERVFVDDDCVGYTTSGAYGYSLGAAVGLGYVEPDTEPITEDTLAGMRFEVDIAGARLPARASLRPLFDPDRARILA